MFLLGISKTFIYSVSVLLVKTVLLLDLLQLLKLFVRTLTYFGLRVFLIDILYNVCLLIIKY
jgi:hypothetical protein